MLIRTLKKKVLRLQIPMTDVLCVVAVADGVDYVFDNFGGVVLGKVTFGGLGFGDYAVEELGGGGLASYQLHNSVRIVRVQQASILSHLSSSAELGDEMEVLFILVHLVEFNNIGVVDLCVGGRVVSEGGGGVEGNWNEEKILFSGWGS